jgi:hypothetical protein
MRGALKPLFVLLTFLRGGFLYGFSCIRMSGSGAEAYARISTFLREEIMKKALLTIAACTLAFFTVPCLKASAQEAVQEPSKDFKPPVLLWEREFDPPLFDISDMNSAGEYIAIQGGLKDHFPAKILFLDSKGNTVREIPLEKKGKRTIPPEQVWLTYYGNRFNNEKFKKSFSSPKEIETNIWRYHTYVSGNGEYYAIVTSDTEYGSWYEFAYYNRTGKLLWTAVPDDNYSLDKVHISYDGSRIFMKDYADYEYFAQKWYLYDGKGNLLKSEDHNIMGKGGKEREAEYTEWIRDIDISENGEYIAYTKDSSAITGLSKAGLMDKKGNVIWEKKFDVRPSHPMLHNNGKLVLKVKGDYLIDITGEVIAKQRNFIDFSPSGNRLVSWWREEREEFIEIFDARTGELIVKISESELFNTTKAWLSTEKLLSERYLLIDYNMPNSSLTSLGVLDIEKKKIRWKKENMGKQLVAERKRRNLIISDELDGNKTKKVFLFDTLKGGT